MVGDDLREGDDGAPGRSGRLFYQKTPLFPPFFTNIPQWRYLRKTDLAYSRKTPF
jgi:hypothetical protein